MNANGKIFRTIRGGKCSAWLAGFAALLSFAAGCAFTARFARPHPVHADSNRTFELMVYHTLPGKVPALESIFRDVSKLQAKHDIDVLGYWVPDNDPAWANTFIYLIAHPSLEQGKKNWSELHADPAFPPYRQLAVPLIEKVNDQFHVDEIYMHPTDFSALK